MQLSFFRNGLKSLEAIDFHVGRVAEQQHIDYQFNVLEVELEYGRDDGKDESNNTDGELSFDYRKSTGGMDISTSWNSMEVSVLPQM